MIPVFADSAYYLALLNPDDALHSIAVAQTAPLHRPILTTLWVLAEVLDALSHRSVRGHAISLTRGLRVKRGVEIVPADQATFDLGFDLYSARPDKDWSLTDCISFSVMKERGIDDALTADRHFEQAGFRVLLK